MYILVGSYILVSAPISGKVGAPVLAQMSSNFGAQGSRNWQLINWFCFDDNHLLKKELHQDMKYCKISWRNVDITSIDKNFYSNIYTIYTSLNWNKRSNLLVRWMKITICITLYIYICFILHSVCYNSSGNISKVINTTSNVKRQMSWARSVVLCMHHVMYPCITIGNIYICGFFLSFYIIGFALSFSIDLDIYCYYEWIYISWWTHTHY